MTTQSHLIRCVFIRIKCYICGVGGGDNIVKIVDVDNKLGFVYNPNHTECCEIIHGEINKFYREGSVSPKDMFGDYKLINIKWKRHNKPDDKLIDGDLDLTQIRIHNGKLYTKVYFDNHKLTKYTLLESIVNKLKKPTLVFDNIIHADVRKRWCGLVDGVFGLTIKSINN